MSLVGKFVIREVPDGSIHVGEVIAKLSDNSFYLVHFNSSVTEIAAPASVVHASQMAAEQWAVFSSRDELSAWLEVMCAERADASTIVAHPGGEGKLN